MKGGKKIAEGGYGCVFHPEINCKGEETTNTKYISKIQQEDFSAKNEIEIGKKLFDDYKDDETKPLENNFAPVISSCPINIRQISAPDIKECSVINKVIDKVENFIIMKIRYIDMQDFDKFVTDNVDTNLIVITLMSAYNHLLKSINLLIKSSILHFDLKGPNVVFDTTNLQPIIVDFGLSIPFYKKIDLQNYFYIYAPEYYVWPIEAHYINMILHYTDEPTEEEFKDLADRYVQSNRALQGFSPDFIKKFKAMTVKTLQTYNKKYKDLNKLFEDSWKTWDNYSLSILYLKFVNYISHTKKDTFLNSDLIQFRVALLLQNIHPDFTKRHSVRDTQKKFNSFLYNEKKEVTDSLIELSENLKETKKHTDEQTKKEKTKLDNLHKKIKS